MRIQNPTRIPTESLHGIQQRLDGLGITHPQRSALENAVMYTADAVDEELDAMANTPVDPAEREVLRKELKVIEKLLKKLTYLEARRRSYLCSQSRHTDNMNAPASGAHHTSSALPSQSA